MDSEQTHPPAAAPASLDLPETPAGQAARAFLHALNTADHAAWRSFLLERCSAQCLSDYPLKLRLFTLATAYRASSGLLVQAIEQATPWDLSIRARPRQGAGTYRLRIRVAEESPYHVAVLDVIPCLPAVTEQVDVGGYRLALRQDGVGQPTVVLEAGMGSDGAFAWGWVFEHIAQFSHVVCYDRAGLGASDPAPTPRSCQEVVTDLHRLLVVARIAPPYVLVGHSLGGFVARLFAHRYAEQVAGLVLVDSAHEDWATRTTAVVPSETAGEPEAVKELRSAAAGWSVADPAAWMEGIDLRACCAQVRATGSLGDLPLVVLSATEEGWPFPAVSADLKSAWLQESLAVQRELARLSTQSTHIVLDASESGHFIQFDRPDVVVDAVRHVVEVVRAQATRSSGGAP